MKIGLSFFLAFSLCAFAAEKYGVYDSHGKRVSTFEAESYELLEKTRQTRAKESNKNLYISSLKKGKGSKPNFRYHYKTEKGAYIEATRKETFSICPDKEIEGTWISEYSVALNQENCLSVQTPNLAGTFRILFLQNSGRTDSIQVLVEQSYIPMGDYSHKIWIPNPEPKSKNHGGVAIVSIGRSEGHYESKKYEQPLIVDKTEFTMRDAKYYSEFGIKLNPWNDKYYSNNEDLKNSMKPFVGHYEAWEFANLRSKLEGLDTVYGKREGWGEVFIDTNASGYRLPFRDEWSMLMRAGASTRYYWGNEEDSLTVSRYTWVRPPSYIQYNVGQKSPNAFGLYDMISPNRTNTASSSLTYDISYHCFFISDNRMPECIFHDEILRRIENCNTKTCMSKLEMVWEDTIKHKGLSITKKDEKCRCSLVKDDMAYTTRLLRKTPKLHKLEKF